uniref:Uncharacterized protein n=1 Tax=Anguilla anguilla TaxID=7936 RepID=A0A0E9RCP0_ANGAN
MIYLMHSTHYCLC